MMKADVSSYEAVIAASFIRGWEAERLEAYQCSAGVWTIGVGHTKGVKAGDKITERESRHLFHSDLNQFKKELVKVVKVPVTQGQFVALMSILFNIGLPNFRSSTLLKKLNEGDYEGCALEFPRWKYSNGVVIRGLLNRRKAEKALFEGANG